MKSCFLCWTCEVSCHDTLGKTASGVSPDGRKAGVLELAFMYVREARSCADLSPSCPPC